MKFKIGQKVICREYTMPTNWVNKNIECPVKGKIYTIRSIMTIFGVTGFLLEEIKNTYREFDNGYLEPMFNANLFRPCEYASDINYYIIEKFKPVEEKIDIDIDSYFRLEY